MLLPCFLGWGASGVPPLKIPPSPLATAVTGKWYRLTLGLGTAQVATQILYSHNLNLLDFWRSFGYASCILFFIVNLVATFYYEEGKAAVAADLYLSLWGCCKIGGTAVTFDYVVRKISPTPTQKKLSLATTGFAISCLSVLCQAYANFVSPSWSRWIMCGRYLCIAVWMGILVSLSFGAVDVKLLKANPDPFSALKLVARVAFIGIYFILAPAGVTAQSADEELVVKLNVYTMFYFLVDSLETMSIGRKVEVQSSVLGHIFPPFVMARLQRDGALHDETKTPRAHLNATVFFSDIVNFVELSDELGPLETMRVLDELFSAMDICAIECGVYKVETIGDAYSKCLPKLPPPPNNTLTH